MKPNPTPAQSFKPHQSSLILAALAAVAAWFVPFLRLVMLPLQYLNTHLHEMSHAIVAAATGGEIQKIVVNADGSGVTPVFGGSTLLEASAGYLGAAVIGSLMIFFGRTPQRARTVLYTIGGLLAFSMIFWVRGDLVGIASGLFWVAALLIGGKAIKATWLVFVVQFLGVEQCLTAVQSVLNLLHITEHTEVQSDALIMAHATGIGALFWAFAWTLTSVILVGVTLRLAWRSKT